MERAKKGCHYFWIDYRDDFCIHADTDWKQELSTARFEKGNYFLSSDEANKMARKLRAVLAGADVIEMPSEEEVYNSCNQYIEQDNEPRYCGCLNKGHYFEGWLACIDWLKSKIVK